MIYEGALCKSRLRARRASARAKQYSPRSRYTARINTIVRGMIDRRARIRGESRESPWLENRAGRVVVVAPKWGIGEAGDLPREKKNQRYRRTAIQQPQHRDLVNLCSRRPPRAFRIHDTLVREFITFLSR